MLIINVGISPNFIYCKICESHLIYFFVYMPFIEYFWFFFFSGIIEEDRILRVLTNLYKSDRLLLPVDSYDGKILPELKDLYRNLFNEAVFKLKDEEVFSLKSAKMRMFIPYQHLYLYYCLWNSIGMYQTF